MGDALANVVNALTGLESVFVLSGVLLFVIGGFSFADRANPRRVWTGLFWILLGAAFAFGGVLPSWVTGTIVIAMVAIDGFGGVRQGAYGEPPHEERIRSADRFGWRIFLPVLMIPALTIGVSLLPWGAGVDPTRVVFVALGYSSLLAGAVAFALTRARPIEYVDEGRRLADAIGAVVILPQLLASLGTLFKTAGVGDVIKDIVTSIVPSDSLFAVILACCLSIVCFTFVLGNSFAAYPVIMAGIGVPLLVTPFHADPALVGAMVLTCASCGTLCTPMAANFNMVPPALFEMRDQYGVIKFQAPFAAAMFVVHVALLWAFIALAR
jgi:uncharacterized membrane protein